MKGIVKEDIMSGVMVLVCGLVLALFVMVSYLGSEFGYMDYIYSSATNVTATPFINTSINGTQTLIIGDISRVLGGETIIKTILVTAENTDTSNRTITVYLNSVIIGNMTATKETNSSTLFENVNWVKNSKNTLFYVPVTNVGEDLKVLNATGIYPSDNEDIQTEKLIALVVVMMIVVFISAFIKKIS